MDDSVTSRVLITIHYYRLRIISNFPLIFHFLILVTKNSETRGFEIQRLSQKLPQIIQDDREALQKLRNIFHALSTAHEPFMIRFACWYTCNYTSKAIHLSNLSLMNLYKALTYLTSPDRYHALPRHSACWKTCPR
jgi:hypothetical protein